MKQRFLKVSNYSDGRKNVPFIRLKGLWLRDCGFETGNEIKIMVMDSKLAIVKDTERQKRLLAEKEKQLFELQNEVEQLKTELDIYDDIPF